MEIKGNRFLVIGGAGFIGSHLVEALAREGAAEVRIFDNFSRGRLENLTEALRLPNVNVFPVGGDILHKDLLREGMKEMDGVFHLAALWLLHCWQYPRSAFEVNVSGMFNVLEAMMETGVKRLVFSSSASVYGDAVQEPMGEDHPFNNTTLYGATKIAGEQMARALYHRYRGTDKHFDYVGLRYMNVYGPRQDYKGAYIAVIMKILDSLDKGQAPVVYGDGNQCYDFIYVSDCARANILAMEADTTDSFYNIGTGKKTTIKQLAELILKLTGSNQSIRYEPAGMTFVRNRIGSTQKAKSELGFKSEVPLPEGLKQLIQWRCCQRKKATEDPIVS